MVWLIPSRNPELNPLIILHILMSILGRLQWEYFNWSLVKWWLSFAVSWRSLFLENFIWWEIYFRRQRFKQKISIQMQIYNTVHLMLCHRRSVHSTGNCGWAEEYKWMWTKVFQVDLTPKTLKVWALRSNGVKRSYEPRTTLVISYESSPLEWRLEFQNGDILNQSLLDLSCLHMLGII